MKKISLLIGLIFLLSSQAEAKRISEYTAIDLIAGGDIFLCGDASDSYREKKCTVDQIGTYLGLGAGSDGTYGVSVKCNTSAMAVDSGKDAALGCVGTSPSFNNGTATYPLARIIASGTVELNTTTVANSGVIASGSSQLLATHQTATGALAASDSVQCGPLGDWSGKTGWTSSATGSLDAYCFVDADGYVQVRVRNQTAGSITLQAAGSGAILKWMVIK